MERCDVLAGHSEEPGRLTRRYGTPALRAAQEVTAGWMRGAGMAVHRDPIGNLIGRYPASTEGRETPALLLGSHLDTVRDAGQYDGALGVLVALAAVQGLRDGDEHLPFAVDVVAFADEEGLRFHGAYLGSRAFTGTLDPAALSLRDVDGITFAEAIRSFDGDPDALPAARVDFSDLLGYVETHIEQGPVLEALAVPIGVVSAIAGQSRLDVRFGGEAGHAGTVPMTRRRDALCAAAEFVLTVEAAARERAGVVATVGQITVEPGARNVVPGTAALTLDVRHEDDAVRDAVVRHLELRAREIADRRDVEVACRPVGASNGVRCDPDLSAVLARAVEAVGCPVRRLLSGAGHDAVALAALAPVAMLFVRCAGGISHHPAESVSVEDVSVAIEVMDHFLVAMAHRSLPVA